LPGHLGSPEDFVVEEIPLYAPCGTGQHTFLWLEKRLHNTEAVARRLASLAGVSARDVGYAGRKDRYAVARQSFSVPGLDPGEALRWSEPGIRVLRAERHGHKLRTGQLAGNRFDIRVRGVTTRDIERASVAAAGLLRAGLPNRFGPQRFGRGGSNVEAGRRLLAREAVVRDLREARFLISSLQAGAFNEVLRTRPLALDRVERGDLARRTDSGGLFCVEDEVAENARAARFEISATGPIFGSKMERPRGAVAERESAILERFGFRADCRPPRGVRMHGGRRPLRVSLRDLVIEAESTVGASSRVLHLRFALPAGSYATVVLDELLGFQPELPARSGAFESPARSAVSSTP
jgi:tRNA pseudouridine13 synthase